MNARPAAALGGCAIALLLAIVIGASFGTDSVSLVTALTDSASRDHDIVFAVRLPRVLLAALAGAGLSVVGVALQALLRNPLAEPFVLGVSGGAEGEVTSARRRANMGYGLVRFGEKKGSSSARKTGGVRPPRDGRGGARVGAESDSDSERDSD